MDSESAPAATAGAAATTNVAVNDGGGVSIQFPQQQQQQQQQQQVMAQLNQQTVPAPNQLPRQPDANTIADLISNIHRRTQQPSTPSQPPGQNQNTNQMNIVDINSTLQNIIGRLLSGQNSVLNKHPVPNHASQLNNVARNNHLQSLQQWQYPNNPTMNLLNSALQSLNRGQTPSLQLMGQYPPPSAQSNAVAVNALMRNIATVPSPKYHTSPRFVDGSFVSTQ